ncbi:MULTISPECIES: hypothetical protein [unclassified Streptomyces]|uniref:phage head completion protein n=1 Tax=unclassified Streptomyces TaxID=2593676 RepID=UPI000C2763CB|nr:hypothetical protein [Streptomyces sp. CB02959]PJN40921.1 hypothetical protein CG747_10310 [Streptomyces sp. CB02959]
MSLLDDGPEEIVIYPAGPALPDGTRGPEGDPVTVRCRVQPLASTEYPEGGYLVTTTYRVIARALPTGPWSRIVWRDQTWTIAGDPAHRRGSRRTQHDTAIIRRR